MVIVNSYVTVITRGYNPQSTFIKQVLFYGGKQRKNMKSWSRTSSSDRCCGKKNISKHRKIFKKWGVSANSWRYPKNGFFSAFDFNAV